MMTSKEILKLLIDKDATEVGLARDIGCTRQMVDRVIRRQATTPWVRRELAERLGMTYRGMWGCEDPGTPRGVRAPRTGSLPGNGALSTNTPAGAA